MKYPENGCGTKIVDYQHILMRRRCVAPDYLVNLDCIELNRDRSFEKVRRKC